MKIIFSSHAEQQLEERNLSKITILQVVNDPDKVTLQSSRRYRAQKLFRSEGRRYLMVVVYDKKNSTKEIVTAFITSKLKKYL